MLSTQCWALPYEYTAISYSTICTFKYDNKLQRFDIYKRYNEYISYLGKTAILSCCLASSHLLLLVSAVGNIFIWKHLFGYIRINPLFCVSSLIFKTVPTFWCINDSLQQYNGTQQCFDYVLEPSEFDHVWKSFKQTKGHRATQMPNILKRFL